MIPLLLHHCLPCTTLVLRTSPSPPSQVYTCNRARTAVLGCLLLERRRCRAGNNSVGRLPNAPPNNDTKMQPPAALLTLSSQLWDELSAKSLPTTTQALWTEHLHIRELIGQMDSIQKSRAIFSERTTRLANLPAFTDWLQSTHHIDLSKVSMTAEPSIGREALGLRTKAPIDDGAYIVKVPRDAMLTWDDATDAEYLKEAMEEDPLLGRMNNVALAIYLLCEQFRADESKYTPYIQTLPSSYTTPLYFSVDQMQLLRASPAFENALKLYRSIVRQFAYFHVLIATAKSAPGSKNTELTGGKRLGNTPLTLENFTFDAYRWAVSTVSTRINHVPSRTVKHQDGRPVQIPALIPLVDLANHSNALAPDVSVFFELDTNAAGVMAPHKYEKADEQVMIYYGQRSDTEHLLHNGFVCATEDNASYALRLGMSASDAHYAAREALLNSLSLKPTDVFDLSTSMTAVSHRLLTYARVFVYDFADDTQKLSWHTFDAVANTLKATEWLGKRLTLIEKVYEKSIEKCEQALRDNSKSPNGVDIELAIQTLLRKEVSVVRYTRILTETLGINVKDVCDAQKDVATKKALLDATKEKRDALEDKTAVMQEDLKLRKKLADIAEAKTADVKANGAASAAQNTKTSGTASNTQSTKAQKKKQGKK